MRPKALLEVPLENGQETQDNVDRCYAFLIFCTRKSIKMGKHERKKKILIEQSIILEQQIQLIMAQVMLSRDFFS